MIEATENRADVGGALAKSQGCLARYSPDGTKGVGPNWQVPWGREEYLTDGFTASVDDEYFKESIEYRNTNVAEGVASIMQLYQFTKEEFEAMIAYASAYLKFEG